MLTIGDLMSLTALCLAFFELGYRFGKNEKGTKNNRPRAQTNAVTF